MQKSSPTVMAHAQMSKKQRFIDKLRNSNKTKSLEEILDLEIKKVDD
jgi:hypothetical protein